MNNNFDMKKFLAEGTLLKEAISSDVEEYLDGLHDQFASEDYENGEEITNIISREEFGNSEAYEDADMFDKAYNEIKENGGTVTVEGQPDLICTIKDQDIIMKYVVQY